MLKNPKYVYGDNNRRILATLHTGEYVLKSMWELGDGIALTNVITNESATFRQIAQAAMNLAVSLTRMGVRKGDVVAVCSENRMEYWSAVIGCFCTGAVVTAFSVTYTKDELKHVMNISKPKYIICSPFAYKRQEKAFKSIGKIILFGDEKLPNTVLYNDLAYPSNVNVLRDNVKFEDFVCVEIHGDDTALILYSSGTTGLPKGVMLSHLNVIAACTPVINQSSTVLTITPWYHSMGFVTSLRYFAVGTRNIYLTRFDTDLYLKAVETYQIPTLSLVPPALVALSKCKTKYDTSSVLAVFSGAAPLYEETAKAAKKVFPNLEFVLQGYGMTESTLILTLNMFNTEKLGSVGTVADNAILKIVDPETKEVLGPNQEGEIYAKGISIMKGYVGKDRRLDFDDEGFFRTGDLGYYDEDKYFYIVDRLKELIKYKGYQVPPAEIESVLLKHEGIRDAAVVGVPDLSAGELPLAFVVLQPGVQLTEKDIQKYVAERLSNPKHLRGGVRFVSEIPKNPTGKILRRELKKMVKAVRSKI